MHVLSSTSLGRDFPGVRALHDVTINITSGRVHVLAGENGAGKSTLVKLLTGVDRPSRGSIFVNGDDAASNPALFDLIAYVPQELSLFPYMNVAENLLLPLEDMSLVQPRSWRVWPDRGLTVSALRPRPKIWCVASLFPISN